jgi:saccharopine dehydrogenase-like NADP-dependent oxidoreductase
MVKILVIGAGRSTSSLISYLIKQSAVYNWQITVADNNIELAKSKTTGFAHTEAVSFDVHNVIEREAFIKANDFIISMLPASMHAEVARDCVRLGRHLATASYVSTDMKELDAEAKSKGLLLLNEIGLDPGIDHASAMKIIDDLKAKGAEITSFKSYCGGLVAPESNNNPWGYKFSWNPRNVILAGQSTAQYLQNGKLKFIPYNRLFSQIECINVEGYGKFDAYANRDSVGYREPYGLTNIKTLIRGTLREKGYCKAWNVFIKLGLTDDTSIIHHSDKLSYAQFIDSFLPAGSISIKEKLKQFVGFGWDKDIEEKMDYLGIFGDKKIKMKEGTAAQILQELLEEKWKLQKGDKDMIVMQHLFEYNLNGKSHQLNSSLVVIGDDEEHTAMAKTVGLPLGITVKNFLTGKFKLSGIQIPTVNAIYEPLLNELEEYKIVFKES